MLISANDIPVLGGEILMARMGVWVGDLKLDGAAPTGPVAVSVDDGAVRFVGTALPRSDAFKDRHALKAVGGAGGFSTVLEPKQHRGVPLETPLRAILADAGETLSSTADAAVLGKRLTSWSRRAGAASDAIGELLRDEGATWRVLDDGTVWVGMETWPAASVMATAQSEDTLYDGAEVFTDLPTLRPGTTLNGRRISAVKHRFESKRVRTQVWYEREGQADDRLTGGLFGLIRKVMSFVDYHPSFAATVVGQQGNGDLQLRIDDERFARGTDGTGTAGAKPWPGVPGISYALRKGARVLVGFLDGRPRVPIVTGWSSGQPERVSLEADRIELGEDATRGIARLNDTSNVASVSVSPSGNALIITPASGTPITLTFGIVSGAIVITPTGGNSITSVISSASSKAFSE